MLRAKKLIGGLGGEKSRWTEAANSLQQKYDGLAGDILISCGIVAYLSPFDAQFRQRAVSDWHSFVKKLLIPCAEEYDLATVLGSEVTIQKWNIFGLPRDVFSIENGIIQDISKRYSLFIDPQSQVSSVSARFHIQQHNVIIDLKGQQLDKENGEKELYRGGQILIF